MAYDVELADGSAWSCRPEPGLTERRMFGGPAFLIQGNMAVSASSQGGLLRRVDPAEAESLISEPHVRRVEMRGRKMDGWLRVDAAVVEGDDDLRRWVGHVVTYARSFAPPSSHLPARVCWLPNRAPARRRAVADGPSRNVRI